MKYYISCAEQNHGRLKAIDDVLTQKGHECVFRWWDKWIFDKKEQFEIAFGSVQAIEGADLFLCLLPATRNSAIELGIALSSRCGKRIIIWSENGAEFDAEFANVYFMHPSVTRITGSLSELTEYLKNL